MQRTVFALLAAVLAQAPVARGAVSVRVVRVDEQRVKDLDETAAAGAGQGAWPGQLTLTLRLGGPEVAGATEYGRLKITEATDDTGASIKPQAFAGADGSFMTLGSAFGGVQGADARPPEIQVSLPAPQRKATRIARVKGEAYVKAGGKAAVVTVPGVAGLLGKRVEDPALKAAKLTVTVVDPKAAAPGETLGQGGANELTVKIVGDPTLVKKIDAVGEDGQSIAPGRGSSTSGNTTVHTLSLERTPDATVSLKIELLTGQKLVRVPLDLKDVPLP